MVYYTVYKTTNIINNKYYIGKHVTKDLNDDYLGSGKILKRAIDKYGINNFKKELLFIFDNEEEMNNKEKELVVISEETYNLNKGGNGGFHYINNTPKIATKKGKASYEAMTKSLHKKYGDDWRIIIGKKGYEARFKKYPNLTSEIAKRGHEEGWFSWRGKTHSDETKKKIGEKNSILQQGKNNSQYGTCWITNGEENKKIKKDQLNQYEKIGYRKGRVI